VSDITKCKVCGCDDTNKEFQCVWQYPFSYAERLCNDCYKWMVRILKELHEQKRPDGT